MLEVHHIIVKLNMTHTTKTKQKYFKLAILVRFGSKVKDSLIHIYLAKHHLFVFVGVTDRNPLSLKWEI